MIKVSFETSQWGGGGEGGRLPDVSALCHFGLQTFRHFAISALRRFGPSPVSSALLNKSQAFLAILTIFNILWYQNIFSVTVAHSLLERKVRVWIGLLLLCVGVRTENKMKRKISK